MRKFWSRKVPPENVNSKQYTKYLQEVAGGNTGVDFKLSESSSYDELAAARRANESAGLNTRTRQSKANIRSRPPDRRKV